MEKLILKDNTEIEILTGAYLGKMCAVAGDFESLKSIMESVLKPGNLEDIRFMSGDIAGAEYKGMVIQEPNFCITKKSEGFEMEFGLRERTPEEEQQENVEKAITYLSDDQALTVKDLYGDWSPNGQYSAGDRKNYNKELYRCLQNHTAQSDWNPEAAPSLWAKVLPGQQGQIGEWQQPDSTNGYAAGDKVTHNGKTWESLVDNNIWEPGVIGVEGVWKEVME